MADWLILFLPLGAACIIVFFTLPYPKVSAFLALGAILGSLVLALYLSVCCAVSHWVPVVEHSIVWLVAPGIQLEFGFLLNSLSLGMLLIVLVVSSAIFYYSIEYMRGDPGFSRYFAYLSLFAFSMIGIVVSNNFIQLFIFWELVGLSSYLLIGFWYEKKSAADAGKKAFLVNRLGDFGFLLGIILLWLLTGANGEPTLNFSELRLFFSITTMTPEIQMALTTITFLIFCGVLGKSAQFPLHVWLPDAMEGPTPVSALIHAATMVAAGEYLLNRTFFLFAQTPATLGLIASIGALTAVLAATLALVQTDIKRVLAYSTLSQLGLMIMALGLGGSSIAMYHLTMHAFFKALLFLAAGSIIHAISEQHMNKMGGLFKQLPWSGISFVVGALALAGIWPTGGFFSKDEIVELAYEQNRLFFGVCLFTSFLTALYISRATVMTFFGKKKSAVHRHVPQHWMRIPLALLAFLSLFAGFFGIEGLFYEPLDFHIHFNIWVAILSSLPGLLGILVGVLIYQMKPEWAASIRNRFQWAYEILWERYFIDHAYDWILTHVQQPISEMCRTFEHRVVVDTMVNGTARLTAACGNVLRKLQTGRIQTYTTVFFAGVVLLLFWFLKWGMS